MAGRGARANGSRGTCGKNVIGEAACPVNCSRIWRPSFISRPSRMQALRLPLQITWVANGAYWSETWL